MRELDERVHELEGQLEEAHRKKERAISQAEQTRRGHVYVISNEGSFGERVLKVGMTRRLEPYERIQELGDASVPFPFDVHAMIYSDDAPALEGEIHEFLADHRINLVNHRKEFFAVALVDLEEFAQRRQLQIEFTRLAEAREFRETAAIRKEREAARAAPAASAFPASPFANSLKNIRSDSRLKVV